MNNLFNKLVKEFMPEKHNFKLYKKSNIIIKNEVWQEIEGYNYLISNYGRVKNKTSGIIKSLRCSKYGYQINLWKNGQGKMFTISRLVANYFIREVMIDEKVIHIDRDIRNNYYRNLKIVKIKV